MKIWSLSNPCSHGEQLLHCTKLCHTTLYYVYYNTHQDLISLQPAMQRRTAIPLHQTTWHHTTLCYANYHMHKDLLLFKSIQHGGAVVSLYYTMAHHTRPCHTTLYCVYYHTRQDLILSSLSSIGQQPFHYTTPHHTTLCTLHYAMYTTLCTLHYAMYTIICYVHYHMHHDLILFQSIQQGRAVVSLYHTMQHHTTRCYAHYTMLCKLPYTPRSDPFQVRPAWGSSCSSRRTCSPVWPTEKQSSWVTITTATRTTIVWYHH